MSQPTIFGMPLVVDRRVAENEIILLTETPQRFPSDYLEKFGSGYLRCRTMTKVEFAKTYGSAPTDEPATVAPSFELWKPPA